MLTNLAIGTPQGEKNLTLKKLLEIDIKGINDNIFIGGWPTQRKECESSSRGRKCSAGYAT